MAFTKLIMNVLKLTETSPKHCRQNKGQQNKLSKTEFLFEFAPPKRIRHVERFRK